MIGINPKTEDIPNSLPSWLIDLVNGKTVFGKKKDALVLEIFDAGGLFLLEEDCKLSLQPKEKCAKVHVSLRALNRLKAKLFKEHDMAVKLMQSGEVKFSMVENHKASNASFIVAKGIARGGDL